MKRIMAVLFSVMLGSAPMAFAQEESSSAGGGGAGATAGAAGGVSGVVTYRGKANCRRPRAL